MTKKQKFKFKEVKEKKHSKYRKFIWIILVFIVFQIGLYIYSTQVFGMFWGLIILPIVKLFGVEF